MAIPRSKEGAHFLVQSTTLTKGLPTTGFKQSSVDVSALSEYDVVVIGAGYTGLIAARDISQAGKKVLLVEARDRIGGRTWTCDMLGNKFEMGGEWIHWVHPFVWSELARYGLTEPGALLETQGSAAPEICSTHHRNGERSTTTFLDKDALEHSLAKLTKAFFDVDGCGGKTIFPWPYSPLANIQAIQKYDSLTVQHRISQLTGFSKVDLDSLSANFAVFGSTPPEEASFLAILHYYALAGYDWSRLLEASDRYKLKIGHSGLGNLIFREILGDSIFNDPVKAIKSQPGLVQITLRSGLEVRSKHIVCTIPLHCLSDVDFQPSLPNQFTNVRHPNYGGKVHIHLDSKIPSWCGFSEPGAPVDCLMTDKNSISGGTYLTGFPGGMAWRAGKQVVEDPEKFLEATFKSCFPSSEWSSRATDLLWHDWNADPFSKGQWAAWGAGQLSTDFKALSESAYVSKEVILANSDWAKGWTGWIDGAIEEGKRAAVHTVTLLNGH